MLVVKKYVFLQNSSLIGEIVSTDYFDFASQNLDKQKQQNIFSLSNYHYQTFFIQNILLYHKFAGIEDSISWDLLLSVNFWLMNSETHYLSYLFLSNIFSKCSGGAGEKPDSMPWALSELEHWRQRWIHRATSALMEPQKKCWEMSFKHFSNSRWFMSLW